MVENKTKATANTRKRKLDTIVKKDTATNNNKKIKRSFNPFDRTSIHPESYTIADKLLKYIKLSPDLIGTQEMAKATRSMNPKGDKRRSFVYRFCIFFPKCVQYGRCLNFLTL